MQQNALSRGFLVGIAALSLSLPGIALAGPSTVTRGPHGAAIIPVMNAEFPKMAAKFNMTVTPFNLVFLGFQGFFTGENIPSAMSFIRGARDGKITPELLTQAAVNMNRLPPAALQDKTYLSNVKSQLETIVQSLNN